VSPPDLPEQAAIIAYFGSPEALIDATDRDAVWGRAIKAAARGPGIWVESNPDALEAISAEVWELRWRCAREIIARDPDGRSRRTQSPAPDRRAGTPARHPRGVIADAAAKLAVHTSTRVVAEQIAGFSADDALRLQRLMRAGLVRWDNPGGLWLAPGRVEVASDWIALRWRPEPSGRWRDPKADDPNAGMYDERRLRSWS
jgi:hypothetical protein